MTVRVAAWMECDCGREGVTESCALCGGEACDATTDSSLETPSAVDARDAAREWGWKRVRATSGRMFDLCPDCARERSKRRADERRKGR